MTTDKPTKAGKPYCGGKWTEARKRSFIMSQLRRGQWPVKHQVKAAAFSHTEENPQTGRMRKMYTCNDCLCTFPDKEVAVDHIEPVVPLDGGWRTEGYLGYDWSELMERLFCEVDGLQVLCHTCHKIKGDLERNIRKKLKEMKDATP